MDENNFREYVCPACGIIDRFGDKWSLRILVLLNENGVLRFNELLKNTQGISQKMLTTTLRTLESHKLVNRKMYAEIPPRVEYSLTELGKSLMKPLYGLIEWTLEHSEEITKI
ncbi:MAG: helix-turn-helix transcriptional regulator [Bacteroidales bacterium]|nr:helix-turn-helix transcriptional regulator [Bacteroidales bacterium]